MGKENSIIKTSVIKRPGRPFCFYTRAFHGEQQADPVGRLNLVLVGTITSYSTRSQKATMKRFPIFLDQNP